jgi:cobalamin biosynthesis Mg chelatase CobN
MMNNEYRMLNKEYRITNNESGKKVPVRGQSIPEGLHVYSQPVSRENTTPAGVEWLSAPWYVYKHLMPLASGRTGKNSSWMKVQRTETLTGNMECKIRKTEVGRPKTEVGRWNPKGNVE